jgi:hypothetical protein
MTTETLQRAKRRDRWVSWFVVGLFVVALILGWVVKSAAEGRTETYSGNEIIVKYPKGWYRADVEDPLLLQVDDTLAEPYKTTFRIQRRPEATLSAAQQALAFNRGRNWSAYRLLQIQNDVSFAGHDGMRVTFAYVETNPDPFRETVPVVIMGEDFYFPAKDGVHVYVFTLTAAEANYERARDDFESFVRSFKE